MMKIGSATGTGGNIPAGHIGIGVPEDTVSRNLQRQIADAQKRLQEISSNGEMGMEEKMKKRQEIQQEITDLNQQLRQHQIEQRKEQQAKHASMADGAARRAQKPEGSGSVLSQASMQAIVSADASMKQAHVQGSVATQMEGRAGVLKAEIKQDAGRGDDIKKKEAELANLQGKAQAAVSSQISSLADANQAVEEAAKASQANRHQNGKAEDAGKGEKGSRDGISNGDSRTAAEAVMKKGAAAQTQETGIASKKALDDISVDVRL